MEEMTLNQRRTISDKNWLPVAQFTILYDQSCRTNSLTVFIIFRSRVARFATQFGNWNSIYHKFRKWYANDVFEKILQALVADTKKYLLVQIDSTFCKAQGGTVCIPDKVNSRTLNDYKVRNVVERFFLRIKTRRRIATRYDKLVV